MKNRKAKNNIVCIKGTEIGLIPDNYWLSVLDDDIEKVRLRKNEKLFKVYCQEHGYHYLVKDEESGEIRWL